MSQLPIKTFSDLQQEVIVQGLCKECGGCVSFCTAGTLNALELGKDGLPRYTDEEKCLSCGICYLICPETRDLDNEVRRKFGWESPIGTWQTITSARTTDEAIHKAATDGGVVTSLLLYMLDRHLIDGAIVSVKSTPFSREPAIATTRDELVAAAGSHFAGSSHLEKLGDSYTTYSPTVSTVRSLAKKRLRRAAIVGTPCQIKTIRKMQCLSILPADIIRYTIGLFCTENLSFDAQARRWLEEKYRFDFGNVQKVNVREDFCFALGGGRAIHVPFEDMDRLARPACLSCTEFANGYADISAGGLGSREGYTTILLRTDQGRALYDEALRQGYIKEAQFATSADLRDEKARMVERVAAYARWKQERGKRRRQELGVADLQARDRDLVPLRTRRARPVGEKAGRSGSQWGEAARTRTPA